MSMNRFRRWSWFPVLAHRGEQRVAHINVSRQGFQSYLPLIKHPFRNRIVPMFEEYFFVRFTEEWGPVASTRGVDSVVMGTAGMPGIIPHAFVRGLQHLENKRGIIVLPDANSETQDDAITQHPRLSLTGGESVFAVSGAFLGKLGIVESQFGNFVTVLYSILGRDVCAEFSAEELQLIEA